MENIITLGGLLNVIQDDKKNITIGLFDKNDLLIIEFGLSGFKALEDVLEESQVLNIEIKSLSRINIKIDAETQS